MFAIPLTGKQKRFLRSKIATQAAILQIGKGGVSPNLLTQIDDALATRELVKIKMLANSDLLLEEAATTIAAAVHAELVQLIGSNIVLYRRSAQKPVYTLPGEGQPAKRELVQPLQGGAVQRRAPGFSKMRGTKAKSTASIRNEKKERGQAKPKPIR